MFPDANTPTTLFNGEMFSDIPVISVKVTKNNTILSFANAKGTRMSSKTMILRNQTIQSSAIQIVYGYSLLNRQVNERIVILFQVYLN